MKFRFQCSSGEGLKNFTALTFFLGAIFLAGNSRAQFSADNTLTARSISGQFIINASPDFSPLFYRRDFAANTNLVRLEPALLAVSAERFKTLLWQQLGLKPDSAWRGKIFLMLRPAHSPDDGVVIASGPILHAWDYRVTLPDVVTRTRYARALSAALLLEIANRDNPANGHSAEIPSWLADGLAQSALDEDVAKVILSTPDKMVNDLPLSSLDEKQRGLDPLTSARATLQNYSALTFDQLSWPTDAQANGDDGGVYLASAQLFVHELLNLKNGAVKMRIMLARLPDCLNWQTAFFFAFHENFQRPVEVEKWWSLRVVDFAAHNAGAQWPLADSNQELANLLSIAVEIRGSSNSLPAHAEISLQAAIRSFAPEQRDAILEARLRNIELAQFRIATPFAALTSGYCVALLDFLGERKRNSPAHTSPFSGGNRSPSTMVSKHGNIGGPMKKPVANLDYHTAIAAYFDQLKKNPQLGIVQQPQPAATPTPASGGNSPKKPVVIYQPAPVDFSEEPENYPPVSSVNKHQTVAMIRRASINDTLKRLDTLDIIRRELIISLHLNFTPRKLASTAP
jgi:hypothetical protein